MKSRKRQLLAGLITAAALALAGCGGSDDPFVNEYEELNGETNSSGTDYMEVDIPDDHRFVNASEEQIRELFEDGDGAIYFGFPQCPWCRNAVTVMDEAAKAVSLDEILYLNVFDIRDQKSLDDNGEIVVEEEGTDFYQYLLEEIGDYAPEYEGLEDPTHRRIYVPLVVIVVDGEVVGSHLGTVESQEDPYAGLSEEQHEELLDIYIEEFSKIPGCGVNSCG